MPTVLVTGATSGLGRYLSERLGALGWTILAHGRDPDRLAELITRLPCGATGYVADLAELSQVRNLANSVLDDRHQVDVLVNNAGVGYGPVGQTRQMSTDGHELRLAVNYLAPALLSRLLVPALTASRPARIVNVGSVNQKPFHQDDEMLTRHYSGAYAYQRSKLALAADSFRLAAELTNRGVSVNCVHPASRMDTEMVRASGVTPTSTVAAGAAAVMRLVTDLTLHNVTGRFFDGMKSARAHDQAHDPGFQDWLAQRTTYWLGSYIP